MSKIQKESKSQQSSLGCSQVRVVAIDVKDTKRKQITTKAASIPEHIHVVAIDVKDTKRKQITTVKDNTTNNCKLLRLMSKIQKESKSQRLEV